MRRNLKILVVAVSTAILNDLMIRYGYKVLDYTFIFICQITIEFIAGYHIGIKNKAIKSENQRAIGIGLIIGATLTIIEGLIILVNIMKNWRG
ncbi:hypothetical protein [Adhaeribacter soli]|uniref:Uncharacterized protein n=1 Tax=Adhaeribacter soli TaxID=2607655 RepID=A0A5N1IMD0_9BACT|nr:hypothetical protein [Adhaeribacter soli]KAA9331232.1 hypothetical protein F0P94_15210 [Adhaeribacter soli]